MESGINKSKIYECANSPESHIPETSNDSGKENNKPVEEMEEYLNGNEKEMPENLCSYVGEKQYSVDASMPVLASKEQYVPVNKKDLLANDEKQLSHEEYVKNQVISEDQLTEKEIRIKANSSENIKSVGKVLDDYGDEFIITMNNSDESDDEHEMIDKNLRILNQGNCEVNSPITLLENTNAPSKKAVCNSVNIPLPPLPTVINSNKVPIVLPTSKPSQNTVPLINLFIPVPQIVTADTTSKPGACSQSTLKNLSVSPATFVNKQNLSNVPCPQKSSLYQNFMEKVSNVSNASATQSSVEMIKVIKWEIANRISNQRQKYQQVQPDSELGPLAKFLFDLGNDLVRETVYNDLVRIQTYRKSSGKLSDKETDDLSKLKDVQAELKELVGPVKHNMKFKCKCGFRSESQSILLNHQEYPHIVENDFSCAICDDYKTRQPAAFIFHMEAMHNMRARMENRQPFWTCNLCPYENNSRSKLTQHKFRCLKNFNLKTNLSQNSVIGMEVNFCLEGNFYKRKEFSNLKYLPYNSTSFRQQTIAPKPQSVSVVNKSNSVTSNSTLNMNRLNNFRKDSSPVPGMAVTNKINTLINQNNLVLGQNKDSSSNENGGFEVCEICGGYVKDRKALRIHFYYAHRKEIPDRPQAPLYCATCFARFWTAQGLQKHLEVHKVTNAAKCLICGHKVPNVLMHMRIVHTKELGSYLAACKCIYCGLICSSKRALESHMVGVHGIMIKTDSLINSSQNNKQKPESSKGCVCVLCNLQFARNVDLTRHCMKVHHTCMKCGMVVADKISLDKHTCLKSNKGLRNCELCPEKGFHPAYHVKHIRDKHIKKCSVLLQRIPEFVTEICKQADARESFCRISKSNSFLDSKCSKKTALNVKSPIKRPITEIEIIEDSDAENGPFRDHSANKKGRLQTSINGNPQNDIHEHQS